MVPELNAHQSKYRFFFCVSWWKQISPQDSTMQISNVYVFFYFSSLVWFIGLFFFFIITCATNERRLPSIFFFNTVHSIMTWNTTENHMPFLHTLQAHKSHRIIVDKSLNMGTSATAINSCVNDFELVGFFFTLSLSLFSWVITVFLRPIKCVSVVMCCSVFFSLLTWRKNDW